MLTSSTPQSHNPHLILTSSCHRHFLGGMQSSMWDFVIFTGPGGDTNIAAKIAEHFSELRPGTVRRFGTGKSATVHVEEQRKLTRTTHHFL